MIPVADVTQIRRAEAVQIARVGADSLMQRAAAGLATACLRLLRQRRGVSYGAVVLAVVGTGNNGGDALFAACRLAGRGVRVLLWRTGEQVHPAGWQAAVAAGARPVDADSALARLDQLDLVIDGVVGIGGSRPLSGPVADFAEACRRQRKVVVAVDLPSGLGAQPPFNSGGFSATRTVTFGALKPCHVMQPARAECGEVELVDIGLSDIAPDLLAWEESDLSSVLPVPTEHDDKYSRGVVGIDAGSPEYPGAGVLAVSGAVGAGAGMVRYLGPREVGALVLQRYPNVVLGQGRVAALVIGPGWGKRRDPKLVGRAVDSGVPLVIDADALRQLPPRLHPGVLLTPHAGELAGLLAVPRSEVEADPLAAVVAASRNWSATVLLKGATQYLAAPDRPVELAVPGPAWTAQAGSGDVLAGIIGTLRAAGLSAHTAALAGASLQACAAQRHPGPVPPWQLAASLPELWTALVGQRT